MSNVNKQDFVLFVAPLLYYLENNGSETCVPSLVYELSENLYNEFKKCESQSEWESYCMRYFEI